MMPSCIRRTSLTATSLAIFSLSCQTPLQLQANTPPPKKLVMRTLEGSRHRLTLPELIIRSHFAAGQLTSDCNAAIARAESQLDGIARKPESKRSFDLTVLGFEETLAQLSAETLPLSFMKDVSPDPATHSEGAKCEQRVGDFQIQTFARRDLYVALKSQKPRNAEETRLLQKTLEAFEFNGLKFSDEILAKVTTLRSKLNELQTSFEEHLNNDQTTVDLTPEELEGTPKDFIARLTKTPDGTHYRLTTKITDYEPVMQNAKHESARQKMAFAFNNRQGLSNTALLEQAIQTRQAIAKLMGYRNWADYQLSSGRTAKNASDVMGFLNGLKDKLAEKNRRDLSELLEFKKTYDPTATEVKAWDIPYLNTQLKKRDYQLDDELIREYFPANTVVQGLFKVYSELFEIKFEWIQGARVWAPDVRMYQVLDKKTDLVLGYFYTDFMPRSGKYEHFAAFTLRTGRALGAGYQIPISAIVGNFNPPTPGKPSLLSHDEVVTLFHEFGHILHQTLTRAPYASLSGSNVAQDFVEAPSQMLENWAWNEKILTLISGHYQDPSKKLPPETIKKMVQVRDFQQAYTYTRQLSLALTDMAYHTATGPVDTAAVYDHLYKEILGIQPVEGAHFAASFGHLMGGYDAGYYGYLWSLVYSYDLFSAFESHGLLDAETGMKYRQTILEKGNMEDAQDLLTQFLGRASNSDAFLKTLR
jgi:thimet oligopeptidase